ncbi:tetratricopeptide repeat protein [Candidatus Poribacteria bacterium]|nr:tetratricopeptide repeat protein [Candidatus Poribacteria bacterium]MYG05883.1 tetratricopeptide repeat protein [Candidatus Poribacteria bacterium]MYK23847.1 tetratricopeptide repeat protein [Candidatus Poribacteria bacterium]
MHPVRFKTTFYIAFSALTVPYLMMLIAAILAGLTILNGCSSDSDPNTPSAVNYTAQGWRFYESGDYPQALLSFERAINFDEALADAHNGVGWSHLSLSLNPPLAQEAFQNAVQLDASNADAWVGLANLLYLRNKDTTDFRSAIRAIDNALQGDAEYLFRHDYRSKADLYALKASCYYYLGEDQSTAVEINKALQIDTTHRTAIALQNLLNE